MTRITANHRGRRLREIVGLAAILACAVTVACGSYAAQDDTSGEPTVRTGTAVDDTLGESVTPKGDVDCDMDVDSVDSLRLLRSVAGLPSNIGPGCAGPSVLGDVNCDTTITSVDALLVLRHVASLDINLPADCPPFAPPDTQTPAPSDTPSLTESPTATGPSTDVLEVHHIDVEQGDAALIVGSDGHVAMIDDGRWTGCSNTVAYLQGHGITNIDYHFATHYDADHIGCLDDLAAVGITVSVACYDRGGAKDTGVFNDYAATCGAKRQTATKGQVVTLSGGTVPVTITVVDLNGAGVSTSEENALGLILKLTYGAFDHVFAGDLPGGSPDIESIAGPEVGDVDVCKVDHHGSASSSNNNWLDSTNPEVCILSVGSNSYGHPTAEALARLHNHGVKTYWTNTGSGVEPDVAWDKVAGSSIVITALPGAGQTFTVVGDGFADTYSNN